MEKLTKINPYALLSVYDKTGIVDFAKGLTELGHNIISTGGTEKALKNAGLPCKNVTEITGFPECLDGRVKTLTPQIHAGILAKRDKPEDMATIKKLGVNTIDVVGVNLYPFQQTIAKPGVTFSEAVEQIDIGGPTMLRAAAKNYDGCIPVVDPADYARVLDLLKNGDIDNRTRRMLQQKVFAVTADYDKSISNYLAEQLERS